jgi:hypothetical protein
MIVFRKRDESPISALKIKITVKIKTLFMERQINDRDAYYKIIALINVYIKDRASTKV